MEKLVYFKNSIGQKLEGRLYIPENYENGIIICHGFCGQKDAENKVQWAKALSNSGFLVLTFDFSGHGNSEGVFADTTYTKEIDDLENAIRFFRENYKFNKLGLAGHSLGAVICILEASKNPDVKALVSLAGFHSYSICPPEYTEEEIEEWKKTGILDYEEEEGIYPLKYAFREDQLKYNVLEELKKVKSPTMFMHGEKDPYVPIKECQDLFGTANKPKEMHIIKGIGHSLENYEEVNKLLIQFFKRHL